MSLFLIYQENGYCHQYQDCRTKLLPYINFYLKVFAQIEVLTTFLDKTSTGMRREATTHSMKSHWRLPLQRQVLAEGVRSDFYITVDLTLAFAVL